MPADREAQSQGRREDGSAFRGGLIQPKTVSIAGMQMRGDARVHIREEQESAEHVKRKQRAQVTKRQKTILATWISSPTQWRWRCK